MALAISLWGSAFPFLFKEDIYVYGSNEHLDTSEMPQTWGAGGFGVTFFPHSNLIVKQNQPLPIGVWLTFLSTLLARTTVGRWGMLCSILLCSLSLLNSHSLGFLLAFYICYLWFFSSCIFPSTPSREIQVQTDTSMESGCCRVIHIHF